MIPPSVQRAIEAELVELSKKVYEYGKEEYRLYKYKQPRSLLVLGPHKSGKTQLYKELGANVNLKDSSDKQSYEKFKFYTSRGEVNIKAGIDYCGKKEYFDGSLGPNLSNHIVDNDRIVFLFDIDRCKNDNLYIDEVIRRLSALNYYSKLLYKESSTFIFGLINNLNFCSEEDAKQFLKKIFFNSECEELTNKIFVIRRDSVETIRVFTFDIPVKFSLGQSAVNKIKNEVFKE